MRANLESSHGLYFSQRRAPRARRGGPRARRGVPPRAAPRHAGVGRGAGLRRRSSAPTRRSPAGSTSTPCSTSAPTPVTSTSSSSACTRSTPSRSPRMPEAAVPLGERQGPRALRARRRAAPPRHLRPHLDLRRRPAGRDPRQGARARRPLGVLVRADERARAQPPARAARRRAVARVPPPRDAADRVRRPRLPRRLRLADYLAPGAVCGHALPAGCGSRSACREPDRHAGDQGAERP